MVPTMEEIEEYLESIEELFLSSLSAATPEMPNVRQAAYQLWDDISRYGPSGLPALQDIRVPGLGDFQIPPPPPPPPPKTWLESSVDWITEHPWTTSGLVLGVFGAGLLVGYSSIHSSRRIVRVKPASRERRQVVVVLGGDNPLAFPLVSDLEQKGYIVIVSVISPESVDIIEGKCHGYVCALVLDPSDLSTIPIFLRSLASTLSRRFPLNASGDPHASPASHPYIHSVISLLTLPSPIGLPLPSPLEHISLQDVYLPYLTASHIAPLQVLQALMPLLRTTPARSRDLGKKNIVVCVPATAHVGLPFASVQAMSTAATLRGMEVLRREINAVALTDKTESMKNLKVVIVDVGAVDLGPTETANSLSPQEVYKSMEDWTASEKLIYGLAFTSITQVTPHSPTSRWEGFWAIVNGSVPFGVRRKPSDMSTFVGTIVGIVSGKRKRSFLFYLGLGLFGAKNCIRAERIVVGAGANTYSAAARLPSFILDTLLNIPHFLVSIRNKLLPVPPSIPQRQPPPAPPVAPAAVEERRDPDGSSEQGSEADAESNSGEGSGVDSWVSLKKKESSQD